MTYQETLSALADPTRRAILEALSGSPHSVGELSAQLPVSRPAVSQHLKTLAATELVLANRQGTRNIYRLNPNGMAALRAYLDRYWGDVLSGFAEDINQTKR